MFSLAHHDLSLLSNGGLGDYPNRSHPNVGKVLKLTRHLQSSSVQTVNLCLRCPTVWLRETSPSAAACRPCRSPGASLDGFVEGLAETRLSSAIGAVELVAWSVGLTLDIGRKMDAGRREFH